MTVHRLPISAVTHWAGLEKHKWLRLVGSEFVHNSYGSIVLEYVDLPYLRIGGHQFSIANSENPFVWFFDGANLSSKSLADEIIGYPEEQRRLAEKNRQKLAENNRRQEVKARVIELLSNADFEAAAKLYESECKEWWGETGYADEKGKAEKRLSQARILEWCREHHFVEDEIIGLIETDKQRAHNFAEFLLKKQQDTETRIPNSELTWATSSGATITVSLYVESCLFQASSSLFVEISNGCHVNYSNRLSRASLHEYLRVDDRTVLNDDTRRIWNFKNGHLNEVRHYVNLLDAVIAPNVIVCCAPSSGRDDWGPGLLRAAEMLGERRNRRSHPRLLRRIEDTVQRSRGGDRSKKLNLRTIQVTDKNVIKEKPIVIIDDVTTTGKTLAACSELLWNAGCNCVGAIALGRTTNINPYFPDEPDIPCGENMILL